MIRQFYFWVLIQRKQKQRCADTFKGSRKSGGCSKGPIVLAICDGKPATFPNSQFIYQLPDGDLLFLQSLADAKEGLQEA